MPDRINIKKQILGCRLGEVGLPHGKIETPVFMPIATRGAVKVAPFSALEEMNAQIILSNTYHLSVRPGEDLIGANGGLHKFIGWKKPILTDSGGFQVFSLASKRKITDEGVTFRSSVDGVEIKLTPESVVKTQNIFGSDISMVLDEVCALPAKKEVIDMAMRRTTDWAARAKKEFIKLHDDAEKIRPLLFGIVQGGTDFELRKKSASDLVNIGFDGYAIGGLSVGEENIEMYKTLDFTIPELDTNKPRYLMGVGEPEDIVEAVRRGVDMFDCVLPTRNARHALLYGELNVAYLKEILNHPTNIPVDPHKLYKRIHIRNKQYATDASLFDKECELLEGVTKSYLRHLFQINEPMGLYHATINNLWFYLELMRNIRAIIGMS